MAIQTISYSNTFAQWVVATNLAIDDLNTLKSSNYTKTGGTLYLNSSATGLSVGNNALFAGNNTFSGGDSRNNSFYTPTYFYNPLTIQSNNSISATGNVYLLKLFSNTATVNIGSITTLTSSNIYTTSTYTNTITANTVASGNLTVSYDANVTGNVLMNSSDFIIRGTTGSTTSSNSRIVIKRNAVFANANNATILWDNTGKKWKVNDVDNNNFYDLVYKSPTNYVANTDLGSGTANSNTLLFGDGVWRYSTYSTLSGVETLTNKTISLAANTNFNANSANLTNIRTASYITSSNTSATTGAITINWAINQNYLQNEPTGTITYTFIAPNGPSHLQLFINSDGTSTAQTINFPGTVVWMSTTWAGVNNKKAVINFWYDGANYYAMGSNQV